MATHPAISFLWWLLQIRTRNEFIPETIEPHDTLCVETLLCCHATLLQHQDLLLIHHWATIAWRWSTAWWFRPVHTTNTWAHPFIAKQYWLPQILIHNSASDYSRCALETIVHMHVRNQWDHPLDYGGWICRLDHLCTLDKSANAIQSPFLRCISNAHHLNAAVQPPQWRLSC